MAAISQKIFSLVGGVSQQPDTIKVGNQLRICDNYYPDVTTGLTKRPGLKGIRKLANAVADGTWFAIFRDDKERYIIQFSKAGALKVWSANTGLQQTVNAVAAEAVTYATHVNSADLQTLQINDYIFVLNRKVVVKQGTNTSSPYLAFGFVNINTVAFNTDYTITIDGLTFSHTTPANASGSHQNSVQTIINALVASINANANYVAQGIGNTIFIRRANNADFSLKATGGTTGSAVEAFKETVTSVAQLPREFLSDRRIKVEGTAESTADNYWVHFVPSTPGQTSGVGHWEEFIAPGTVTDLDEETMPHVIIREANGTFTYRQLDLASANSSAGPTSVSGIPTFVGIATANSGGHVVGEIFGVTGGTGNNLRLQVDKVQTNTSVVSSAANSASYIRQDRTFLGYVTAGRTTSPAYRYTYVWIFNDQQIGVNSTGTPLTIGNTVYQQNGAYQTIGNELRAGITATTTAVGVISAISIVQAGQGYTASNTVSSAAGDTFTIVTVNTAPIQGDASRLKYWKYRDVGDATTNPMPSFVDNIIDCISFYKNRLIFTSRQNVICSQAGDYFNFFASTVITIVDSDPIDISASSTKPVQLKHAIPSARGLLLFGNNSQYMLETTTEAFSPKTAEINPVSYFSQTDSVSPVDLGSSYLFLEEGDKASSIYEMDVKDASGAKSNAIELTRIIPAYIPAAIYGMKASPTAGTVALLSRQEPSNMYLYRFFMNGDQKVLSSWFRWKLPGTIEFVDFDQDIMYVVTKHGSNYVLSTVSLLTDTPNESLLFEGQYLDVRLDLFDYKPTLNYNAGTDLTRICFKDGFEDTSLQPVLMFLDPAIAGYFEEQTLQYDATAAVGEKYFLTADGNQTTSKFALGYKYEALAQLPAFYFTKDESRGSKDTVNIPRISRIKVNSYNSGPYKAVVRSEGRDDFTLELPQINADYYLANNVPIIRNAQSTVPVLAKGDQFEFELIADNPFPTAFTSLDWEGTYDNKGIQSL
jgi:hypothetical protein